MSKKSNGGRGSSMHDEAMFQRELLKIGHAMMSFERVADRLWQEGVYLGNMTVKPKGDDRADYLVIVRARTPEGAKVAFVAADSLAGVLTRAVSMLDNGSISWKEDNYA